MCQMVTMHCQTPYVEAVDFTVGSVVEINSKIPVNYIYAETMWIEFYSGVYNACCRVEDRADPAHRPG